MEHRRMDALARALASLLDRRETLAAAVALLLAAFLAGGVVLAKKGDKGGGKGGKGKKKKRKKRRRGGSGGSSRDCTEIALEPGADLHGCDLREHPDLASANLDLTEAKLEDTILSGADLSGVRFRGARLWRAKLDGANLQGAKFGASGEKKTDIFGVDFTDANLQGADLDLDEVLYAHYAIFCRTTMPNGDSNNDACPA